MEVVELNTFDKITELEAAFSEGTKEKRFPIGLMTVLLIVGVIISFAHNTTPAPMISNARTFFVLERLPIFSFFFLETLPIIIPVQS